MPVTDNIRGQNVKEVAMLFLRLGMTAFGGPAAHIAMMQREVVEKRKWMSEQHFLDLIGATNLIPGPNSTEMAIHIGRERAGWKGLIIAGLCFILPAVVITGIVAWFYKRFGQLPQVQPFVYGITPAVIAVVMAAIYPLARKSVTTTASVIIGVAIFFLSMLNVGELYLMFGAGILALGWRSICMGRMPLSIAPTVLLQIPVTALLASPLAKLFWIFLKTGAILYGSGYVLFAFLDTELVSTGLLSRQQLVDAIAVGQFTPGPVFSSVTFIGYQMSDWKGAALATTGIFLPSFVFVALLNPLVNRMRKSSLFSTFLDAVNLASVALILAVCCKMGMESIHDWRTIIIAAAGMVLTFGFRKINSAWIVAGGSAGGYLLSLL